MKQGDFTQVAKFYDNRPAYSEVLIENLLKCAGLKDGFKIAEIGAGTGKLTKILASFKKPDCDVFIDAVEPNDNMRQFGKEYCKECENVKWHKGSGEETGLESDKFDLVVMASSFHWTDPNRSLPEFARILKKGGSFAAIWNPRNIEENSVFYEIEEEIKAMVPNLNRVSSGTQNAKNYYEILQSTGDFKECFYMEIPYSETMSKERYIGTWKSVNDIQAQAGEKWSEILKMIEQKVAKFDKLEAKYLIKAYIAKRYNDAKRVMGGSEHSYEKVWDYTKHAKFYSHRPNYSPLAIDLLCEYVRKCRDLSDVADIGAGTGNLSIMLGERNLSVTAVEPNDAMRSIGTERTKTKNVSWVKSNGVNTTLQSDSFDWVTFGSSFNVMDRDEALRETHRILRKSGIFTCMWNHRDLNDPLQKTAQNIIKEFVPSYEKGVRREDQRPIIEKNRALFDEIFYLEQDFYFHQNIDNYILAWKSVKNPYWDLETSDGAELFEKISAKFRQELPSEFDIKYTTRAWSAKKV